jgi:tetratricopeptide (TPR) repeat protein
LYKEGSLGLARERFEAIVAKDPDSAIAYFYLGLIHSSEEELSKAVEDYEEVIRLIPGHAGARLNLAINLERLHREEDAISQYRKILEAGPPAAIAETAEKRLLAAEKRIRGLSTGLSYSLASDTNTNLSDTNPADDIRSDLSVNISYQYKLENGVRLRFSTTPTYSTYHIGNFDYLNTSSSISATMFPSRFTLVGGYTNRTNRGLVTSNRFSGSDVLFGEGSTRIRLPKIFSPFSDENVTSDLSLNLSYTNFESDSSPFFSAYNYSFGFGINQPYGDNSAINLGYSYSINDNKYNDTLSQDYAYRSQGVNIGFEWLVAPGFSANARYSYSLVDYSNPDSVSQFTEYRRNDRHVISLGGSYRYHDKIRFFANMSWIYNKSNLPVGFVLDPQDVIEGQQSGSLGEYRRGIVTLGMNLFI